MRGVEIEMEVEDEIEVENEDGIGVEVGGARRVKQIGLPLEGRPKKESKSQRVKGSSIPDATDGKAVSYVVVVTVDIGIPRAQAAVPRA
jgi:hypothetical protein